MITNYKTVGYMVVVVLAMATLAEGGEITTTWKMHNGKTIEWVGSYYSQEDQYCRNSPEDANKMDCIKKKDVFYKQEKVTGTQADNQNLLGHMKGLAIADNGTVMYRKNGAMVVEQTSTRGLQLLNEDVRQQKGFAPR